MRLVVVGDDGVGKSSMITAIFKNRFVSNIEDTLPPLTFPRITGDPVTVIDTSPSPELRAELLAELRIANCLMLVYSDKYTFERIGLFWMPFLRSCGINLPIVLCHNKQDLKASEGTEIELESEDIVELMQEYKEIDSFILCSAKTMESINEAFYLCHRAVAYPLAPLFNTKDGILKTEAQEAFKRIYFLLDPGFNGLDYDALSKLQNIVFKTHLAKHEFEQILQNFNAKLLTLEIFLKLMETYCVNGRHETVWEILRSFGYTNSFKLNTPKPKLNISQGCHVELSPLGYEFLVDMFTLCDKDNDGGLNTQELQTVFSPNYGIPESWQGFPATTLCNDMGYPTLQGWLAQWSMFTFLNPMQSLSCLQMMGFTFRTKSKDIKKAIKVSKPSKPRNLRSSMYRSSIIKDRQVFNCFVFGSSKSGKSSIIRNFVNSPTTTSTAVNTVELPGGKQCYLVLQEPNESVLEDEEAMQNCDVVCLAYDSSDPHSFSYLINLKDKYPLLSSMPLMFAALKADLDRVQQHSESPDIYIQNLGLNPPMHVSSEWPSSLNALYVQLMEIAINPGIGTIKLGNDEPQKWPYTSISLAIATLALGVYTFKRYKH